MDCTTVLQVPARSQRFGTKIDNVTATFSDEGFLDGNKTAVHQISLEDCRDAPEHAPTAALLDRYDAEAHTMHALSYAHAFNAPTGGCTVCATGTRLNSRLSSAAR